MQDIESDTGYDTRRRTPDGVLDGVSQTAVYDTCWIVYARASKADGSQALDLQRDGWLPKPESNRPAEASAARLVRLDGAELDQYGATALSRYIGYLPQDVVLFEGTVAENIARLSPSPNAE